MLADYQKGPSDPDVTDTPRLRGSEQQPHRLISNCQHFPYTSLSHD
jgi:hypothetical protein